MKGLCSVANDAHWDEWVNGSAISPEITKLNLKSVSSKREIKKFLGWKVDYTYSEGWIAGGQFKPDIPILLDNAEKPAKYLTSKAAYDAILLKVSDPDYWAKVEADPSIPIILTEGAKKAGACLTQGDAAIGLCGVWMAFKKGGCTLVPSLQPFVVPGRTFIIVFDADKAVKNGVSAAGDKLAKHLIKRGCKVKSTEWDLSLGKGIDDLIVQQEIPAYREVIDAAQPYEVKPTSSRSSKKDEDDEERKAFELMLDIAQTNGNYWHNSQGNSYADILIDGIRHTYLIRGKEFKEWLSYRLWKEHEKGPSAEAMQKVLNVLNGLAKFEGVERESHLRIAEHEGSIYIDMADERWQVIEVSKQGWRVIQSVDCPVRFVRAASQLPLPMPEHGGDLSQLWQLLPVAPDSRPLLLGWLLSCFTTTGAKPILVFSGPKGSGKSEAATTLKMLTDPGKAAMMPSVGDSRNMASAAMSRWVMIYDNLTHLNVEQQDVLCRTSTGAGFSHRSLFTDLDETFTEYKRPQILTSVDLVPSRSDLLDRCVLVQLERIPEAYRIPIHNLESVRAEAVPKLLGFLLSALVVGLQRVESLHLERLPRMADFALMATACEPGLGLQDGEFMRAYQANIETAVETAVECNPIAAAILALMEDCTQWQGSTQDLLDRMKQKSTSTKVARLNHVWLGRNLLGSLKADLEAVGIDVDSHKGMKGRQWIIQKVDGPPKEQKIPSLPSLLSYPAQGKDLRHDSKHDGKTEPENTVILPSSLKPTQDKAYDGNDSNDGKTETLGGACDHDIDPYPVGSWIDFSRTGSKSQKAQVIPRPVDWTGSDEVGVFVLDVDGHPLLVPLNRIRKRVGGMG